MSNIAPEIDIVFLWVDGSDPEFARLKQQHLPQALGSRSPTDQLVGDHTRYFQMEEIGYAVRSVRLFAPWLRTIHIVIADGQRLPGSVLAMPGVRVVAHSDIIPRAWLPTFSSLSIEPFVHRIAGLSELFIYGNDDCMFWNATTPSYFVHDGQVILRGSYLPRWLAWIGARHRRGHPRIATRTALLLYRLGFERVYRPAHSFEVFRKSTCVAVWNELETVLRDVVALKFRDDDRALFWAMLVDTYEARYHHPVQRRFGNGGDIPFARVEESWFVARYVEARLALLRHSSRQTVCFNTIPPGWQARMRSYLDAYYAEADRCHAEPSG